MYMAKLNIFGLVYDTETKTVTYSDGAVPPVGGDFTFENYDGYNCLQYATEDTGKKIIAILKQALPPGFEFELFKTEVYGPIQPPRQLQLRVTRNGIIGEFNVGLIANSILRSGSIGSFRAELKYYGLGF